MSKKLWRDTLPSSPKTWSEADRSQLIRTEMDVGYIKTRRRFTGRVVEVQIGWNLRAEQYDELLDFFNLDLRGGLDSFDFPHPYTGEMIEFRFVEPPAVTAIAPRAFSVSCRWESLP